jgi:hypothetical protein
MRRAVVLLALLGAVMLVYAAPMAEAALNKIRCTTSSICEGTNRGDRLIDRADSFTEIRGKEGNDTYVERSGEDDSADTLWDWSDESNDTYYISNVGFNTHGNEDGLWILDWGGSKDVLDLSSTGYRRGACPATREDIRDDGSRDDLYMNCPGRDNIIVFDYYSTDSIEKFKYENGTFDEPAQSDSATDSITTQEQAPKEQAPKEPPDKKHSSQVSGQAKNASPAGGEE